MPNAQESRAHPAPSMKVWRPQGFAGVEVERLENLRHMNYPAFLLPGHEINVVRSSYEYKIDYARNTYRFDGHTSDLFLSQHPGEVFEGNTSSNEPMTVWTLRLYPEAMQEAQASLGVSETFSYFPEMLAPAGMNDALAKLTAETIAAFDTPTSHMERESKLLGLLHAALKYCSDSPPPEVELGQEHKVVSLVKEVLHTHPEYDHTLTDLATLTELNKYYLHEVFKRDVGLTPDQYLKGVRVNKAKELLVQGHALIDVAHEVGFCDQSHLNRVFKKYTQVTPGRFQRDSLKS